MWFDKLDQLPQIALRSGFCLFEIPANVNQADILPNAYHVKKAKKEGSSGAAIISIEQIREIFPLIDAKQSTDFYVVIEDAETMTNGAISAYLKRLEEPKQNVHQVLLTKDLNEILAPIRSRAQIFRLKTVSKVTDAPDIDEKILALAKEYLSCTPQQLPSFVKKLTKDSKTARDKSQQVVDAAITLMYKSYFATGNEKFLIKLDQLLKVQENLTNGNLKLQLVAHML